MKKKTLENIRNLFVVYIVLFFGFSTFSIIRVIWTESEYWAKMALSGGIIIGVVMFAKSIVDDKLKTLK